MALIGCIPLRQDYHWKITTWTDILTNRRQLTYLQSIYQVPSTTYKIIIFLNSEFTSRRPVAKLACLNPEVCEQRLLRVYPDSGSCNVRLVDHRECSAGPVKLDIQQRWLWLARLMRTAKPVEFKDIVWHGRYMGGHSLHALTWKEILRTRQRILPH